MSELKPTQGRHRSGKSAFKHYQGVFYLLQTTHKPHFIYNLMSISKVGFSFHTRTYYYFSEFYLIIFKLLLFIIMATMDITESGFQTPASKKRKASGSPSLLPACQPATPPTSYKNRTPLIATGIDPKFKTTIQIMSELRQYHRSLRVFKIRQSSNSWIFIGDTPKDFAILQSETKMKQVFVFLGQKLRCHCQNHITL